MELKLWKIDIVSFSDLYVQHLEKYVIFFAYYS